MAYDKLVDSARLDGALTATANAIREKSGTTGALAWDAETGFSSAIGDIQAGEELNFSVVRYNTASEIPTTAEQNTFAVVTASPITGYLFSVDAPANPVEGHLWIRTGSESAFSFNAFKGNTLMVYPVSAKQYIGGVWKNIEVRIYKDAKWSPLLLYLYDKGDECTGVTGGWVLPTSGEFTIATKGTGAFVFGKRQALSTAQKINLPSYSKFCVECTASSGTAVSGYLGRNLAHVGLTGDMLGLMRPVNVGINELDILSVNEEGHVSLYTYYDADAMTITRVWLE